MKKSVLRIIVALLIIMAATVITSSVYAATLNVDTSTKYKAGDTVTVTVNYDKNNIRNSDFDLIYDDSVFSYVSCKTNNPNVNITGNATNITPYGPGVIVITHDATETFKSITVTFTVKGDAQPGTGALYISRFVGGTNLDGSDENLTNLNNTIEVTITHATHSYTTIKSQTNATCTTAGTIVRSCACGDEKTETIPATGHNYTTATTQPTCTATGTKVTTCTNNGCTYRKEETIPATVPHNYTTTIKTPATCTTTGTAEKVCADCGDKKEETIAKKAHNFVNGKCSVCGTKEPEKPAQTNPGTGNAGVVITSEGEKPTMLPQTGISYITIVLVILAISFTSIVIIKNKR